MDFFEETLDLTDEFPKEHLEFLNEFMNCSIFYFKYFKSKHKRRNFRNFET
jgi:hypothetical protein